MLGRVSNLDRAPALTRATVERVPLEPLREALSAREVTVGETTVVRRLLPHRGVRKIGARCFADHYGPEDVRTGPGMQVGPHPHIGLQTVSWLLEGEILHRDSLGSTQAVRPGQLNLMTAGRGIAHSEESPPDRPQRLHGVQLWIALPDARRHMDPAFDHHPDLPVADDDGMRVTVLAGEVAGLRSPARVHSPLVGLDVALSGGAAARLPLQTEFEHAALVTSGTASVDTVVLSPGTLLHLGRGRRDIALGADRPARLLLLGGEPFGEEIVMWWNLVARTTEEIAAARADWEAGRRFGEVRGYPGARLIAPPLPEGRLHAS